MYKVVGYETMKMGLHKYFADFSWKNTELKDFVGSIDWAYSQSGDTSMGADFNFISWCDSWLTTSGINILEPEVTYNDDGSINTFAVKQTMDLRGKNVLRKHFFTSNKFGTENC